MESRLQPTVEEASKPSVLIISQYFFPEHFVINSTAAALAERGYDITVLTGIPNYPSGVVFDGYKAGRVLRERWGKINVIRVPMFARGRNSGLKLTLNYVSFAISAGLLGPLLIRRRPDVLLVYQLSPPTSALPGLIFKFLRRSKLLLWVQDLWPDTVSGVRATDHRLILGALKSYMRAIYRSADIVAVQSKSFRESVTALSSSHKDIRYLPNTVDQHYRPLSLAESVAEKKLLRPGFRIVVAGNIGIAQDVETIVRAAKILRDEKRIQWTFLGNGSRRRWLESQIQELGLEETVRVLGPFPSEQMPAFFAQADALMVSLLDREVFERTIPSRLQAYLACGRPILGSVGGESARIINQSEAGLVSRPGDPESLANTVLSMSRLSQARLVAMGEAARRYYAREFDHQHWNDILDSWLRELAPSKSF